MLALVALAAAHAGALFGVDYVPFGRGDIAWVDDGQGSGSLVAETDGLLVPPISAWGGGAWGRNALLGGLGVARITTTTQSGGQTAVDHVGAVRPSLDVRRYLADRVPGDATVWLQAGGYGVIPSARDVSDAYTSDEQANAHRNARAERGRIGGFGGRAGLGAEVAWQSGLGLGARYAIDVYRGRSREDNATTTSVLVRGEAAVVLSFAL